jgi:hypothetical protein
MVSSISFVLKGTPVMATSTPLFSISPKLANNVLNANGDKTQEKDTLTNTTIKFNSNPLGIQFPDEKYEQYKGYQYLIPFFEKLFQAPKNQ